MWNQLRSFDCLGGDPMTPKARDNHADVIVIAATLICAALALGGWLWEVMGW